MIKKTKYKIMDHNDILEKYLLFQIRLCFIDKLEKTLSIRCLHLLLG